MCVAFSFISSATFVYAFIFSADKEDVSKRSMASAITWPPLAASSPLSLANAFFICK